MNKKFILLSSTIMSSVLAIATLTLVNETKIEKTQGIEKVYTMTLDENNRISNIQTPWSGDKTGEVKTDEGNTVTVGFNDNVNPTPEAGFIIDGGTFYNTSAVNGLIKLDYDIEGAGDVWFDYGFNEQSQLFSHDLTLNLGHNVGTFAFDDALGRSSYFNIRSTLSEVTIHSLKFYYTCIASPNPERTDGHWSYETNSDGENNITITGYHIDSGDIPEDRILVVPNRIDGKLVTKINTDVLDNVAWVRHLVLPFVGTSRYIGEEGQHYSFGSIFGFNSAHKQYTPIQQMEGSTYYTWYIPKLLEEITLVGCNRPNDKSDSDAILPAYSFYGASTIMKFNIYGNIQTIGNNAFTSCSKVTELYLDDSITSVGNAAFLGCNKAFIRARGSNFNTLMTDAVNPDYRPYTYGYIEHQVIDGIGYDLCRHEPDLVYSMTGPEVEGITNFVIPEIVEGKTMHNIVNRAFEDYTSLIRVTIPQNFPYVGHLTFKGCYKANFLMYQDPDNHFQSDWNQDTGMMFTNYVGEEDKHRGDVCYFDISDGIVIYDSYIDGNEPTTASLTGFSEPINTTAYSFYGRTALKTVTLDYGVRLGKYSFAYCSNLEHVTFNGTVNEWNDMVNAGHLGPNCFIGSTITEIECTNGNVPLSA